MGIEDKLKEEAVAFTKQFKDVTDEDRKNLMKFLLSFIEYLNSKK